MISVGPYNTFPPFSLLLKAFLRSWIWSHCGRKGSNGWTGDYEVKRCWMGSAGHLFSVFWSASGQTPPFSCKSTACRGSNRVNWVISWSISVTFNELHILWAFVNEHSKTPMTLLRDFTFLSMTAVTAFIVCDFIFISLIGVPLLMLSVCTQTWQKTKIVCDCVKKSILIPFLKYVLLVFCVHKTWSIIYTEAHNHKFYSISSLARYLFWDFPP